MDVNEQPLDGRKVALTGRFASIPQARFADLISDLGGDFVSTVSRRTHQLVVGEDGCPLAEDGHPSKNLQTARQVRAYGYPLEILGEEEFLRRYELYEPLGSIRRRYTIDQLSRLLEVPGRRIRSWLRLGLIEPIEIEHRLAYFNYRQVSAAKRLLELLNAGVPMARLVRSLDQIREWLPEGANTVAHLATLEERGLLLVRLADGRLADATGQMRLDFEGQDNNVAVLTTEDSDTLFAEALAFEDQGRLDEARQAYERALDLDADDPVIRFNLGNVFYQLGSKEEAAESYRIATESDPLYAESWNNLGSVQAELRRYDEAVDAFRHAVQLIPNYSDAHYNLADTLEEMGRRREAIDHWKFFLVHDPTSPWAGEVRQRIERSAGDHHSNPPICH